MAEREKSPEELSAEVAGLQERLAELEERLALARKPAVAEPPVQRLPRASMDAKIEFIGDFDVALASGVDISDSGVAFEVDYDLPFEMRFVVDGQPRTRRARCVWMRRKPEGGCQFGLEFIEPEPGPEF